MTQASVHNAGLKLHDLRDAIRDEYKAVALEPDRGFHFHTGRPLAEVLGYRAEWLERLPEESIESFAGTGNPFSVGKVEPGERVVDVGCGAGMDSLIAAHMTGSTGRVIGIDMSETMLEKARRARAEAGLDHLEFRYGYGEELPLPDGWADVVISNGALNLMPDKSIALEEMVRILKPEGRVQIADIVVEKAVPVNAKRQLDLWTG